MIEAALPARLGAGRTALKQVVRPTPVHWMHHLEVRDLAEIDDEVEAWLAEAAARAT